jgi:heme-degrading monooxygenase HmoA
MFVALWEFEVKSGDEERFESAYGNEGDWARLFRHARGYKGTRLVRDAGRPWIYLTMDFWYAREEYEKFLKDFQKEYDALDRSGEELTTLEKCAGYFQGVA